MSMAKPHDINDSFDLDGFWWLPEAPERRVAGVLTYTQEEGPVLTLTGTFDPTQEAFGSEMEDRAVIHGTTKDEKHVSLFKVLHMSRKGGFFQEAVHEVYRGHTLALGWHFASEEEQIFSKSYVIFEDIEEWLGHRFFDFRPVEDSTDWRLNISRSVSRPLGQIQGVKFNIGSGFYTDKNSTSFTISAHCYVEIAPDEPKSLRWHSAAAFKIRGLASLCAGRHLPARRIMLDGPEVRFSKDHSRHAEVSVYASMLHQESKKARQYERSMIQVSDFPDPADELLQRWFDGYEDFSSAQYLFLTALADRGMFINTRFSFAVQALEVFHRLSYPTTIIAPKDHATLQDILMSAIPDDTPAVMRDKLRGLLAFSNEPSLGQRLKALLKEVRSRLGEVPAGFDKAFVKRLVDTRNYYTHFSPNLEGQILAGADMHYGIRRIVLLLIVLQFLRIGFDPATVRAAIDKHGEFKKLWQEEGNPS